MNKKLKIFLFGTAVIIAFFCFSYLVKKDLFTAFDFDATVKLQDNLPRRVDGLFSFFSIVGNFEVTAALLIVLFFLFKRFKKLFLILPIFIAFNFIELYAKYFIDHLPPPHFFLRTQSLVDFPQFYIRAVNSYPSGHSGRTVFLCVIFAFFIYRAKKLSKEKKLACYILLTIFCLIMLVSRVYLGEHWTTDVIGGTLLGGGMAILSLLLI